MKSQLFGALILLSCSGDSEKNQTESVQSQMELYPPQGGQGTSMEVRFDASSTAFTYNDTSSVDFGDGITVTVLNIDD